MTDRAGVPDLREELNRKSFDTIEWLIDSVKAGKLSDHQFSTGVDAVFMAVNGLVDDQMLEIVTAAADLCNAKPPVERRVFNKGAATLVVSWVVGEQTVVCIGLGAGSKRETRIDNKTPELAREAFNQACARAVANGFKEL